MRTLRQMLAYANICAAFDLVRLNRASGCRKPKGVRKKAELLHTGIAFGGVKAGDGAMLLLKDQFFRAYIVLPKFLYLAKFMTSAEICRRGCGGGSLLPRPPACQDFFDKRYNLEVSDCPARAPT